MSDFKASKFKEFPVTYSKGNISIDNIPEGSLRDAILGIQIAHDGRVWICINGISFMRFSPSINQDVGMGETPLPRTSEGDYV